MRWGASRGRKSQFSWRSEEIRSRSPVDVVVVVVVGGAEGMRLHWGAPLWSEALSASIFNEEVRFVQILTIPHSLRTNFRNSLIRVGLLTRVTHNDHQHKTHKCYFSTQNVPRSKFWWKRFALNQSLPIQKEFLINNQITSLHSHTPEEYANNFCTSESILFSVFFYKKNGGGASRINAAFILATSQFHRSIPIAIKIN